MAIELFIEDKPVDLTGDENISLDYAIAKIGDIQSRTGARSVQFSLLKTARNRAVFENPDEFNSLSTKPYTKLGARLYVDGIDMRIAFAVLEATNDTYNVRLYGENSDLFDRMKAAKLQDLSFCQYDHFWNFSNVTASRNNTHGYIYPVIDNYNDSPNARIDNSNRRIDARNLLPAVFVHTVLEAIESYFGITIDNQLSDIGNYPSTSLIMPFSRGEFNKTRNPERYEVLFDCTGDIPLNMPASGLNPAFVTGVILEFNNKVSCSAYWNRVDVYVPSDIQFSEKVEATIDYTIILESDPLTPGPFDTSILFTPVSSKLLVGTVTPGIDFMEIPVTIPATGSVTVKGSYTFTTSNTELYENGLIMAVMVPPNTVVLKTGSQVRVRDITILEDSPITYSVSQVKNNFVTVASALPDWTCADFLKQYCLLFGALISYNQQNNTLSIIPFAKIKNNIASAVDWSDKLDFSEPFDISTRIDGYGQLNTLKYADDDTVRKPEGTDKDFAINDNTIPPKGSGVELQFAATETVERLIGVTIPQIKNFADEGANFSGEGTQRILVLNPTDTSEYGNTTDIVYVDGTNTSVGITKIATSYFIQADQHFNLGFDNAIFEWYYKDLAEVIDKAKQVQCLLRLTPADINQLDFTRPVYIKHFNAYFYINTIKGYNPARPGSTNVELIKLF